MTINGFLLYYTIKSIIMYILNAFSLHHDPKKVLQHAEYQHWKLICTCWITKISF